MAQYKSYNYSKKQITATISDNNFGNYIWLAFEKDLNKGTCALMKVSANDPSKVLFDIEVAVDSINCMAIDGYSLVLGVSDATNYLIKYNPINPLSGTINVTRRPEAIEVPIEVVLGGGSMWWLFPGNSSGENAKVIKTSTSGTWQATIDLIVSAKIVLNARGLAYDNGDLWVATYTDPIQLWRVFDIGGGIWDLQQNDIV